MMRVLIALVVALIVVGTAGVVRRLSFSDAQLMAHARRAADALAQTRHGLDPRGLISASPSEKALRAAAAGGPGLQLLRKKLSDRALTSMGVLVVLLVIAFGLFRRSRLAYGAGVATCVLIGAGALAALVPALRVYRLVGDGVVAWELVELLLLAVVAVAFVVIAMLERTRGELSTSLHRVAG
jgi:hypothetical protein